MGALNKYKYPVIFVVGPTAAGKSQWALSAAQRSGGCILNADSLQFYRGLDIGTAKPSASERSLVPHLMFDIRDPNQDMTAADYRRQALSLMTESIKLGPVFVVGGSGFYIQALERGVFQAPPMTAQMRENLARVEREKGLAAMYAELLKRDPETAHRMSSQDRYRIHRALGLIFETGLTVSEIRKRFEAEAKAFPYPNCKIGFWTTRPVLRERVEARVATMLKAGFVAEVEGLRGQGFGACKPLQSVGYKEVGLYLSGQLSLEQMRERIVISTMQLAKRQLTWFRRFDDIHWFGDFASADQFLANAIAIRA